MQDETKETEERMKIFFWIFIVVILVGILCLLRAFWEIRHFQITRKTITSEKLPCTLRFAVVSDLHNQSFGKDGRGLIRAIQNEAIDAILVPGDLIIGKKGKKTKTAEKFLEELSQTHEIFYSPGNHETRCLMDEDKYGSTVREYLGRVMSMEHVHYLSNRSETFCGVRITGLSLDSEAFEKGKKTTVDVSQIMEKLGEHDTSMYEILLAHTPMSFPAYADWGTDLVLSGHNHGGIVRLPFLGGMLSAELHPFHPYNGGVHKKGKTTMIVSRGLGTHTLPIRFLNRPELIFLTLQKME